jgi:hypothetical protein
MPAMPDIDTEWFDICFAVIYGPATWEDWFDMGPPDRFNHEWGD